MNGKNNPRTKAAEKVGGTVALYIAWLGNSGGWSYALQESGSQRARAAHPCYIG